MRDEKKERARIRFKDYLAAIAAALQTTLLPFILLLVALTIVALVFAIF